MPILELNSAQVWVSLSGRMKSEIVFCSSLISSVLLKTDLAIILEA